MKKILLTTLSACLAVVSLSAQTSSDNCLDASTATAITGPGTFSVAGIDGTEVPDPICADNGPGATNGEWYRYEPTASVFVTISTDLPQNSGKDTRVHVYEGSCGSLTCIVGDDDAGTAYLTVAEFDAVAGNTYYIAWDDRWDNSSFDRERSGKYIPQPTICA